MKRFYQNMNKIENIMHTIFKYKISNPKISLSSI